MQPTQERIYGPYSDRGRYRVIAVAAALGHSGPAVTMQHYVAAGTVRDLETQP